MATPKLNVDIPGVELSETISGGEGGPLSFSFVGEYFVGVYEFAIGLIALFAVIVIMFAGVRWIFSAGDVAKIKEVKDLITGAVVGLMIALLSYSILHLINPNLVSFDVITLEEIERIEVDWPVDDLPAEYSDLADKMASDEALGIIPAQSGDFSQKAFYDKCGDPATMIAIADKFIAQPLCQGPCHCAPTIKRWQIQSGCNPDDLKGAGLVKTMRVKLYQMKHPNGKPVYIERSGDDTAHLSPGDILFIKNGHVGMYYRNGYTVDSGTGKANQKTCFSSGCPRKIWDSYGTSKCTSCSLIKGHTPADWYWARGQLQKDLVAGKVKNNVCYKIWHNTLSASERKSFITKVQALADKAGTSANKTKNQKMKEYFFKIQKRHLLLVGKLMLPFFDPSSSEKKTLFNLAPSYCTSCVGNQCIAQNKWTGRPKGSNKYGYDTYADYQKP